MNDIQKELLEHWYAWIYEQEEDETIMSEYLVRKIGKIPKRVLEVACGGGKLCIPLAQAGHNVTGIDQNEHMLHHLHKKANHLPNLSVIQSDILTKPWGKDYDVVILGSNLMVNIVTDRDYKRAQKNLLERAYDALKTGGLLFIDYECPLELSKWTPANHKWVCFEGTDDRGNRGRYIVTNSNVNDRSRIVTGSRLWEISPAEGESFTHTESSYKFFPTLEQTCAWLYRVGFTVESINGGYNNEPFDRDHRRAVIWCKKIIV